MGTDPWVRFRSMAGDGTDGPDAWDLEKIHLFIPANITIIKNRSDCTFIHIALFDNTIFIKVGLQLLCQ